jgi:arylsulfatase A-like enzyme
MARLAPLLTATTAVARPNIVVVMTDDQDVASMRVTDHTRRLIQRRGTGFASSYVTTPLCCPSRATLHTGLYTHNHGVVANEGSRDGAEAFSRLVKPRQTFALRLKRAGCRTGYVGKYLNSPDGRPQRYGRSPRRYRRTCSQGRRSGSSPGTRQGTNPFFLMLGTVAPHDDSRREA